jgi:hypothetical protein
MAPLGFYLAYQVLFQAGQNETVLHYVFKNANGKKMVAKASWFIFC